MRKRTMYIALVGGLALAVPAAVAIAGPWDGARSKAPPRGTDEDSVAFTVTAGKGRLGVSVIEISPELRAHLGAPRDRGVLINTVRADSPAARAGVAVGDVVTEVDGDPVGGAAEMLAAMSDRKKGQAVTVELIRDGKPKTVRATMEDDPGSFDVDLQKGGAWRIPDGAFQLGGTPGADRGLRGDLGRAAKRIEELEKRLERLERR
jgi:membrane-associated protease RseP (regulator of RpoE activity)